MRKAWFLLTSVLLVGAIAACSDAAQGEACEEEGKVDGECEEGLVCGKQKTTGGDLVCLKQCSSQADCASGEDCNGTAGSSLKGCRPR